MATSPTEIMRTSLDQLIHAYHAGGGVDYEVTIAIGSIARLLNGSAMDDRIIIDPAPKRRYRVAGKNMTVFVLGLLDEWRTVKEIVDAAFVAQRPLTSQYLRGILSELMRGGEVETRLLTYDDPRRLMRCDKEYRRKA